MTEDKIHMVRTVCPAHCGIDACGILAHVQSDRVVKVEPAKFPDPKHRRICLRGLSSLDITYHPDRLQFPMKRTGERGEGKFERISWDDALDFIADRFKMTPTARYADILLPVASYLEFSDLIPHPYPYVQLQQKVIEPLYESRSDVDIAAGLAERLGFKEYFAGGQNAFIDLILDSGNDSIKGITREKLKEGAMPLAFIPQMEQEFDYRKRFMNPICT
ncbi:MAG: molybdopterin-dependent oxidoreductase [bacterium]|nr:molybdopterin-dependent oxidoreductase [bacterium]